MPRNFTSFQNVGTRIDETDYTRTSNSTSIFPVGIKTPIILDQTQNDLFVMNMSIADQIDDNLSNLIQANKGERLIRYNWGANLRELLTEFTDLNSFDQKAMVNINTAVNMWMPFVKLKGYSSEATYQPGRALAAIDIYLEFDVPRINITDRVIHIRLYVI